METKPPVASRQCHQGRVKGHALPADTQDRGQPRPYDQHNSMVDICTFLLFTAQNSTSLRKGLEMGDLINIKIQAI